MNKKHPVCFEYTNAHFLKSISGIFSAFFPSQSSDLMTLFSCCSESRFDGWARGFLIVGAGYQLWENCGSRLGKAAQRKIHHRIIDALVTFQRLEDE